MPPETLLAFERTHPRHDGTKEETIRAELGVTPARYYVLLGRAARSVEGMAADAITGIYAESTSVAHIGNPWYFTAGGPGVLDILT